MIPDKAFTYKQEVDLKIGSIVSTDRTFYPHVGIIASKDRDGRITVISNSNSRGCVVEETLAEFLGGGDLRIDGYPSSLPPHAVLARARAKIGSPYSLINFNCEHFVRYVHGLEIKSPQLTTGIMTVSLLFLLWRLSR